MTESKLKDTCEYNPDVKRPAYEGEHQVPATVIVGADGNWRLCDSCAALPEFKRYRVRKPIKSV